MFTASTTTALLNLVAAQVFAASAVSVTLPSPVILVTAQHAPVVLAQAAAEPEAPAAAKPAKKPAPKKPAPVTAPGPQAAPDAAEPAMALTAKVQAFYEETADFTASFEQRYTYKILGRTSKSSGTVSFKKPGLMRWDYLKPRPKAFIVDGETLWMYSPEDHSVIKRPNFEPDSLSSSITFLWGKGKLADEFDITLAAENTLKLVPKTAQPGFASLRFVVDPKTGQVLESTVFDAQGNTNHIIFSKAKLNTGLDAKQFEFTPPKGVSVQVLGDDGLQ
ncbi:MAG: outer membrane lipoprotein carrier protein LolA [Deltaproteobacteria bacterium]|nr:outer membrane lipoprotein carrier protein LolA [Deltaproteobacteria bacterium]